MPPSIEKFSNKTNFIRLFPSLTTILICIIYYAGGWILILLRHTFLQTIIPHIYIYIYKTQISHSEIKVGIKALKALTIFLLELL